MCASDSCLDSFERLKFLGVLCYSTDHGSAKHMIVDTVTNVSLDNTSVSKAHCREKDSSLDVVNKL